MMECHHLVEKYLDALKQGFKCLSTERRLRIITPYTFPDNDFVEVFVEDARGGSVRVSDLGETYRHLHSQGFDITASPKRKFLAETIASRLNVQLNKGVIEKQGSAENVGEILLDVIVAVRGIADLIYTSKTYEPATFTQEVQEYLEENDFNVKSKPKVKGSTGKQYFVDFQVLNGITSYVQTLSPTSTHGIKGKIDATFRLWSDFGNSNRRFSLLNDIDIEWRDHDLMLLDRVSQVSRWSEREKLIEALRTE